MTITLDGEKLALEIGTYVDGTMAIQAMCEDGEPYATVSTRLAIPPAAGCFWLKDWSENEPISQAMLGDGTIVLTGRVVSSGFVTVKEAKLVGGK